MKKTAYLLFAVLILLLCVCSSACGASDGGSVRLTFADAIDMTRIEQLSGSKVEIVGYMATVSPVSGKYMYLMNLPYQSCPYCVPNTQQLSNTIAVYAKDGEKFEFTDGPINVTGTLETGDFKDEYGYTYNYRISGAVYSAVDSTEASLILSLWEKIANAGLASDVYSMFDYIDFECNWPNYTARFAEGEAYLYPADVQHFESGQFSVQSAEGFFDGLCSRAEKIGDEVMAELIKIIRDGETLVNNAVKERADGNYAYNQKEDKYALDNGEALVGAAQALYTRYALWLENFSLSK